MIIPKKLQVVTEKDLLKKVAKELNISERDVNHTFEAWLVHLENIVNNTEQCTVYLPHVGRFYASLVKMKRGMTTERLRKFKEMKQREIERLGYRCKYNPHRFNIPVILAHGISKKNRIPFLATGKEGSEYYSPSDIVNKQVEHFFREDIEFAGNDKLKEYFLRKTEDDFEINTKDFCDSESED